MSTQSPLVPQGALPEKSKSYVRVAVFAILGGHAILLIALQIAGCKKTEETPPPDPSTNIIAPPAWEAPPLPTNPPPVLTSPPPVSVVITNPPPPPPPPPPVDDTGKEHTIARGDSFYSLGRKYKVSMNAIANANPGVDSAKLKPGQKIKIPAAKPATDAGLPPGAHGTPETGEKTYAVKSGDNLGKIAKTHGITLKALRAANNLKTDRITVGQKLKIPAKAVATPETAPAPPPPGIDPATGLPVPAR